MHGLLCFLLFAGALHVDLGGLLDHRWTIAALSTVGVLISVAVVGTLTWFVLDLLGLHQRLLACLTFGALISPTDPVAVMGLLKELRAPASLEAQIAGESLFNDGVGVVVFLGWHRWLTCPAPCTRAPRERTGPRSPYSRFARWPAASALAWLWGMSDIARSRAGRRVSANND
jgi:hypothetical protein